MFLKYGILYNKIPGKLCAISFPDSAKYYAVIDKEIIKKIALYI